MLILGLGVCLMAEEVEPWESHDIPEVPPLSEDGVVRSLEKLAGGGSLDLFLTFLGKEEAEWSSRVPYERGKRKSGTTMVKKNLKAILYNLIPGLHIQGLATVWYIIVLYPGRSLLLTTWVRGLVYYDPCSVTLIAYLHWLNALQVFCPAF